MSTIIFAPPPQVRERHARAQLVGIDPQVDHRCLSARENGARYAATRLADAATVAFWILGILVAAGLITQAMRKLRLVDARGEIATVPP